LQDGGFARILVSRRKAVAMGLVTLSPTRKRIMLTHALGCLAAALSMSLAWPQVFKSCVQRRTSGLSATASTLGVAMPIGWITYGLLSGDRIQVVTNTVTGLTGLAILLALLITQPQLRNLRALRVSGGSAAAVIAAALLSGASAALPGVRSSQAGEVLGLLLAGVSFLSAIPQPLALLRDRNQDLSGLRDLADLRPDHRAARCLGLRPGRPDQRFHRLHGAVPAPGARRCRRHRDVRAPALA
jgi:uncharacterized protein with PQ loop repeat